MKKAEAITIAGEVLELASQLDRKIAAAADAAMIKAWAQCFQVQGVWPTEAREAVFHHYAQPNAFSLMPGDVIAYCARQPVHSSPEHASDFLDAWARHPYSDAIEAHTGIRPPFIAVPDSVDAAEERRLRVDVIERWVCENRAQLVDAVMVRRHQAVAE